MRADAERFFAVLDTDRDGRIGSEERMAYEATITPEVQVNSAWKRTRQEAAEAQARENPDRDDRRSRNTVDGYQLNGLQGAARYGLLNLPEPVSGADADFNRIVTLDEFRHAASYRFQLLDSSRLGYLTMESLQDAIALPAQGRSSRQTFQECRRHENWRSVPSRKLGLTFISRRASSSHPRGYER